MLQSQLQHAGLLHALARAGHGSGVLLADANFPVSTVVGSRTTLVELAISADVPSVTDILALLQPLLPIEAAIAMASGGAPVPAHDELREMLGPVELALVPRLEFYAAARSDDIAVTVRTGDTRHFSNVLLTVGAA